MKNLFIYAFLFCILQISKANPADNLTFSHVGNGLLQGSYLLEQGVHKLSGGGIDAGNKFDNCDFSSIKLTGDVQITARVLSLEHANTSSKAGIMIRKNTTPESQYASMYYSPEGLSFNYRVMRRYSGRTNEISTIIKLPYWLKLIRQGDMLISQRSEDGENWHTVEIKMLTMGDTILCGLAVTSQDTTQLAKAKFDNVHIEKYTSPLSTEMQNAFIKTHKLFSINVKDSFEILVGLPLNYDKTKATKYPVTYHLDGGDVEDHYVIRNLMTDKLVPEVITVGIGYVESLNQRIRDYGSGFENFYKFMKEELIPFIDEHYNTNTSNRTLYGYSFGGLCCFQTLFKYGKDGKEMPFQGIIAGSPSLRWSRFPGIGQSNFQKEEKLYKQTKTLPINFYTCMGSEEGPSMVPYFNEMTGILKSRNYENFNFESVLNKGLNHASNKRICYREGYLWLLNQDLPKSD